MTALNSINASSYRDLIDFDVVDRTQASVGSLHSLWADQHTGQLEFLGVKTGWLFGSNHVVPADGAQVDEARRTVQVNYEGAFIKEAPAIAAEAEISEEEEAEIYRYYNSGGNVARRTTETHRATTTATDAAVATTTAAATTGAAAHADTAASTTTHPARTPREAGAAGGETIEVALQEEQLRVGKRNAETGAVRLRKIIRTETVNTPVELRSEDVVVERIAAQDMRPGDIAAADFKAEDLNITLHREEAVVAKETVVTGAVRLRKTEEVETQNVSDTVRKEDVVVDKSGVHTTHAATASTEVRHDDPTRR